MNASRVHLDHNSTTPMREEVLACWLEVARQGLGNPSGLHAAGRRARAVVDDARARVAAALAVHEDEIFFTSGATEANNWALQGVLRPLGVERGLVTTGVEHSSILEPARALAEAGHPLEITGVDVRGFPDPDALRAAARRARAGLVALGAANNETGALPPLDELSSRLREDGDAGRVALHVDAVQALGRVPLRLREWGASLASFSAHKCGGPPGVGVLWKARGVTLAPGLHGGGQELGLRPGTENVPGIAAAALTLELAVREQPREAARLDALTRKLWADLRVEMPALRLLGPPIDSKHRLPNTLCVLVPETDGKVLVTRLDLAGLEVSAGSACASGSVEPSHVLLALGLSRDEARSGLRLSLGRNTTAEDCKRAVALFHSAFASSRST